MGTFQIDLCKGMTGAEMKAEVRRLSRALSEANRILVVLGHEAPEALAKLPQSWREKVANLIAAYSD